MCKKMHGKIVCIKNADPGFDFIFTKNIKGLITEYGGPNSHMCIRCSELGIPAAIGVGNSVYKKIKKSKKHYWIVLIKRLQRSKMLIGIIPKIKKKSYRI